MKETSVQTVNHIRVMVEEAENTNRKSNVRYTEMYIRICISWGGGGGGGIAPCPTFIRQLNNACKKRLRYSNKAVNHSNRTLLFLFKKCN